MPHRVKVLLNDVTGHQQKLLVRPDWDVAMLLARLRSQQRVGGRQALILTCNDGGGHVQFPSVSTLLADLPVHGDAVHCSLETQKAFG